MTTKLPESVNSPLTGQPAALERSIPVAPLLKKYLDRFGYDAGRQFEDVDHIGVYRCETGFRFYYPFSLAGEESLYRCLEKFDWNYKEHKWEHFEALRHIQAGQRILDIGCGEGNFLAKARLIAESASGIELNKEAAEVARRKGLTIHAELVSAHAPGDLYDVVTSFQVLEHVSDPLAFLRDCLRVLRPGGTLVIGVPNDDSFLRLDPDAVLNQPPHHMGLWNRQSLTAIAEILKVSAPTFETEPLAEMEWYQAVIERAYMSPWQRSLFHRFGFGRVFARYVKENSHTIDGHTILAIYRK